jgi:endonuclease/exonuclease/phosphatase family metal-dependent hydrolase
MEPRTFTMGCHWTALLLAAQICATNPASAGEFVLRVLTYNIHGLPIGVDHSRYAHIGRILAQQRAEGRAPHVVAIQEAFHRKTRDVARASRYPFLVEGPKASGLRAGSGLQILSEFPISDASATVYRNCGGVDCLARKGVLKILMQIPGTPGPIEIYDTHLNASYSKGWPGDAAGERIRIRQVDEIRRFMEQKRTISTPAIFAGDFNFRADGFDYLFFNSFSEMENSARTCAIEGTCSGDSDVGDTWAKMIDHQFFASGTEPPIHMEAIHWERTFEKPVDGRTLSDHPGIEVHYRLSW